MRGRVRWVVALGALLAPGALLPGAAGPAQAQFGRAEAAPAMPALEQTEGIRLRPIVATRPGVRSMLLWGRHTPRYVRIEGYRYVSLMSGDRQSAVWWRPEAGADTEWRLAWRGPADVHQSPTILVDRRGRLHLIYVRVRGDLRHLVFEGARHGNLRLAGQVDTSAWGDGNYYIGGAYLDATDSLLVCGTTSPGNVFRCGAFRGNRWSAPNGIATFTGHAYLYPSIQPTGATALVATAAYPQGAPYDVRTLNAVMSVDASGRALQDGRGRTYGHANVGRTYFENDITIDDNGRVYILLTRARHAATAQVPSELLLASSRDGFMVPAKVASLTGSLYTLDAAGDGLHALGGGVHAWSADDGRTWRTMAYELPGYPSSRFAYGVAQVLQPRSGTVTSSRNLTFLQELSDRASGQSIVVEVELPVNWR